MTGNARRAGAMPNSGGGPSRTSGHRARGGHGAWAAAWTLAGVATLFGSAVMRLGGRAVATLRGGLTPAEWGALVALTLVMVYAEGLRTFHVRWVPRVIERARAVRDEPIAWQLLGPLYGMSLVKATRRRLAVAWLTTGAIVAAVIVVRHFPDPWRGIVDFAVAAALAAGIVSIAVQSPSAFRD